MSFIETVSPEAADGALKAAYADVTDSRGAVANFHQAMSLNPDAMRANLALYKRLHFGESPLSRRERELVATVVSRANRCNYCVAHHADAFGRHASEPGLQALVATDFTKAPLSERERAIAAHAIKLTETPGDVTKEDADRLRQAGLTDREILDLTLETAYFNFATRLATGLGVSGEDVGGSYQY